ncbi:MAG: prepilin-type N-terminal cleavage/methylation domain-containing protein [Candidatus Riflebacteria bacterium]|nr:prepilin-type N-terminal cleavage/methylation domain-containing protein [Candidatus Riflebacteria bacterium]
MTGYRSRGFSFIELVLTLVVIGLALLPILSTYSASHQNTRATMEEVISVNFASELMEALQALPFDQLCLMNSPVVFDNGNFSPDPFEIALANGNHHGLSGRALPPDFETHLLVDTYPDTGLLIPDANMLCITVTVRWGQRNRKIQLMTLKGRY